MRKRVICEQQRRRSACASAVRCLDSVMSLVSVTKLSSLMQASVAEQASLSLTWSETPEDTFSHDEAYLKSCITIQFNSLLNKGQAIQCVIHKINKIKL